MNDEQFYRVTFVRANGFQYETTGRASNEAEAVRLADELLENDERIGISDFLAIISATPFTCPRQIRMSGIHGVERSASANRRRRSGRTRMSTLSVCCSTLPIPTGRARTSGLSMPSRSAGKRPRLK